MDLGFLFVVGMGVVIAGTGLVMRTFFSDRAKAMRLIKRAARKPIADVRDGEVVKIVGSSRSSSRMAPGERSSRARRLT